MTEPRRQPSRSPSQLVMLARIEEQLVALRTEMVSSLEAQRSDLRLAYKLADRDQIQAITLLDQRFSTNEQQMGLSLNRIEDEVAKIRQRIEDREQAEQDAMMADRRAKRTGLAYPALIAVMTFLLTVAGAVLVRVIFG